VRLLLLVGLTFILALPGLAAADGKVFARVGADPTIPDQQALIHYAEGVQTLAIETRFEGDGREFAWVVPLPNVPEISAATPGLLPTLRTVFAPELADPSEAAMIAAAAGLLCAAIVVLLLAAGRRKLACVVGVCVLLLLGLTVLVPSMGKARGGTSVAGVGVTVHSRKLVGEYETATISSSSAAALSEWLGANGFTVPPAAAPVIADYAADGWVFIAVRLAREATRGISSPHPLVFRFEADRCIYPMRLTGVQDRPLSLDLYIFADQRAVARDMSVARCAAVNYGPPGKGEGAIAITHTALAELAAGAPVATRLSATLMPAQMQRDIEIQFRPFRERGGSIYSGAAAQLIGINGGLAIFVLAAVIAALRLRRRRDLNASVSWLGLPVLVAAAAGFGVYAMLPKTDLVEYGRPWRLEGVHRQVGSTLLFAQWNAEKQDPAFIPTLEWAQALAAEVHTGYEEFMQPVKEEDSPGNYIIRMDDRGLAYVWYDLSGQEHEEFVWRPADSSTSAR
jgi:hypothetical protein